MTGALEPTSNDVWALCWEGAPEWHKISDVLRVPTFPPVTRHEIMRVTRCSPEQLSVLEAVVRLADYGDIREHDARHVERRRILRRWGVQLPRGKRPGRRLQALVENMTPILLRIGVPLAFSERSRLVHALRLIAELYSIDGDPRDELRRLRRLDQRHRAHAEAFVWRIFAEALNPLDTSAEYLPPTSN